MMSYNGLERIGIRTDIEINPEREVMFNFSMDNIPDILNISYCDVTNIIDFFNSEKGGIILQKALSNELSLNLFVTDSIGITDYERNYLKGHEVLFRRKNINLFQTWYDPKLSFNYYLGCTIHTALEEFIDYFKNFSLPLDGREKHFLTLNNFHTPAREDLFEFYNSISTEDREKFLCSFRFKNIFLEKDLPDVMNQYSLVFGENAASYYSKCLIEIVSESSEISITEKCYKPLLAGVPFLHWIVPSPDGTHHQIEYLKAIGIDTVYFGIDYSDLENVKLKTKELLSLKTSEILEIYKDDFEKAKENKIKFYNWLDSVTKKLVNI